MIYLPNDWLNMNTFELPFSTIVLKLQEYFKDHSSL